jgi:hypothetical protein
MAKSSLKEVEAHWDKLIENFQTTSVGFYASVEEALKQRKIPGLKTSRVEWNEGGILSPRREYLRVTGERNTVDMCAAPFGTGFFFSSWLVPTRASWVLLYGLAFAVITWFVSRALLFVSTLFQNLSFYVLEHLHLLWLNRWRWSFDVLALIASFGFLMWAVAIAARRGLFAPERAMIALPIIGWIYGRLFLPETYYRIDTMRMFQSSVHSAMMEVIEGLTSGKGVRGLSDDDRKPAFRKLM